MLPVKTNGNRSRLSYPSLLNDFFNRDFWNWDSRSLTGTTLPPVNVRETKDDFVVEMAAPGMKKDDFTVELDGNLLTISSEKENEQNEGDQESNYSRREYSYTSFSRSFQLPKDVVEEEFIKAKYTDGVLHLTIPKKEKAKQKPPKKITIE